MVTKVACRNRECTSYNIEKPVASAMVLSVNWKVCPACGEPMRVAEQLNVTAKGPGKTVLGKGFSLGISKRVNKRRGKGVGKRPSRGLSMKISKRVGKRGGKGLGKRASKRA